jgi:hypothetical protein
MAAAPRELNISLSHAGQLFTADDVSPLSDDYTPYTAQAAMDTIRDELLRKAPSGDGEISLVLHLPLAAITPGLDASLTAAVRRWVRVQNAIDVDVTDASGAIGRRLFWAGLVSFFVLQFLSINVEHWAAWMNDDAIQAVGEGLSVTSWVMLWVPVQIFTVEVWRARIRRRRMRALERIAVSVVPQ